MTFPVHDAPGRRWLALAILFLALVPGCSKRPPAPEIPGATKFMVFASDRGRAAGSYRIYYATFDGAGAGQITPRDTIGLVDRHPSLSLDGHILCYQSHPGRAGSEDVMIFDRSTNALINDPDVNTGFDETEPQVSLDGTKLVFVRDSLGTRHIRLYDLPSSSFIPLPGLEAPGFSDWAPSLDAMGQTIAFVSDRNGTADVMVYRRYLGAVDDSSALRSEAEDVDPAISGNGHYVAFASNRANGGVDDDLYVFDLYSGLLLMLPGNVNTTSVEREPSLSQDGSYLLFESDRPGGQGGVDIWFLNRIAAILSEPNGASAPGSDVDPYIVWP